MSNMDASDIEKVQLIGDTVCEGCGFGEDCGVDPEECPQIQAAIEILNR